MLEEFALTKTEMRRIIRDFHGEMKRGLCKKPSSLKMLPAYVDRPTGKEKGVYLALDLGGTNFRVLTLTLRGGGRTAGLKVMKFAIPKRVRTGDGKELFSFLARSIKRFLAADGNGHAHGLNLGFTFSFPIKQRSVASGDLVVWTKGFKARGVVGQDVVALLEEALADEGLAGIRVSALANDTVGTLVARAYGDPSCDVGVIIGTGTNACYADSSRRMIINIEWGNFNKIRKTRYDRLLDAGTENPGRQILEKMVSGMYLGELARLCLMDLARSGLLDGYREFRSAFKKPMSLKSEYVSAVEAGGKLPCSGLSSRDRRFTRAVCEAVSLRAARISAAAIAAVVTKIDPRLSRRHTIAVDGSVYEKHPGFARNIERALRELFGRGASRIKPVLSKDGSGKGAAIIAAVVVTKGR